MGLLIRCNGTGVGSAQSDVVDVVEEGGLDVSVAAGAAVGVCLRGVVSVVLSVPAISA